jgi:hypothetical protein
MNSMGLTDKIRIESANYNTGVMPLNLVQANEVFPIDS